MITCDKCSTENPLGRVFCGKCGSKLDLTRMTSDTVTETVRLNFIQAHWLKMVIGLVVILLGVGALAFVPKTEPIGKAGTPANQRMADAKIKALVATQTGKASSAVFTEEEINAQLDLAKGQMEADYAGVSIRKGFFEARLVTRLGPIPLGSYEFGPSVSYHLRCGLLPSGKAYVVKATMGSLPLGPAKSIAQNAVLKALAKNKDWPLFTGLSDLKMEDGKMTVTVRK